jgi:hypothetical protein
VSPPDDPPDRERAERHRAREQRKAASAHFELPKPKRLERTSRAPEREILTARERLARDREARDSARAVKAFLTGLVVLVAVLAIAFVIASAFDTGSPPKSAPWGAKGAPTVTPAPLSGQ